MGWRSANPSTHTRTLHEKRDALPSAWTKQSRAPRDAILPVRIGLKQRNLEHGDRFLHDISDPDSPNFGKHWTGEQVANMFAPHPETSDATLDWLHSSGIDRARVKHSHGCNWVEFSASVSELEDLLQTKYYHYKHETGGSRIACDKYGLPHEVREHVDFIMPTIQLDSLKPVAQKLPKMMTEVSPKTGSLDNLDMCRILITINCLRAIYKIPVAKFKHESNRLGIAEWSDYLYLPDLQVFLQRWTSPKITSEVVVDFISIDGGKHSNLTVAKASQVIESALDFQTAYSIIHSQSTRLCQIGDSVNVDSVGTFNIFLDALDGYYCTYQGGNQPYVDSAYPDPNEGGYSGPLQCGGAPVSNVISVSYAQIEGALPVFYQERQCREWMKLALQGVSVIFASGDSGVANTYNSVYPNACLNEVYGPLFQSSAVETYLTSYARKYGESVFNSSSRGYPDVAALGLNLVIVYLNNTIDVGGTSASAPIFESIINLLNEERLEAGKRPVGFLNPFMYENPGMFNDGTEGWNPGCGTNGFPASKGWDPVTGLGTPNYEKMREVFLALPY
ncbi:activation domain containing protein [Pyrenophora tritici-repentis]|uniref:Activation domain containing protein n=1 Tax=Pyrenophora tritici-repentis TaxID=45151 RepID=A0A922NHQ0_9PLEO|nr:activation domain containing protein [Pyrenophora tritici-repentis]KAI1670522.1 activation domain containing protein [Pyrenophora tritici-repentis]KAI1682147.1 activation domain containing protein [Pyrenophora tritici-repentis]